MRERRTTVVVGLLLAALVELSGCGSRAAPVAGTPSQISTQVPGTRPSQTIPPGFARYPSTPVATVSSSATPGDTPSEGIITESTRPTFAIVDQTTGDYVLGAGESVSSVEIGIHGVGKAWLVGAVHIRRTSDGTIARFDGPGHVDARARFGGSHSMLGSAPVDPRRAHLRIEVVMTPDGLGHADIWIDGRRHRIVATEPPHTAEPVVTAVVTAFRKQDWGALYDLTVRLPGMTKAEFVHVFGRGGSVSKLAITGETVYRVSGGVGYADTPAHVVATIRGRQLDRHVAVELVFRSGRWRFSSLARNVDHR
jgi:hypothetical protein